MTRLIIFLSFLLATTIAANIYQYTNWKADKAELTETIANQQDTILFIQEQAQRAERIAQKRLVEMQKIEDDRRQAINQLERLKNENADVKNWADTPIPDALRELLNEGRSNHLNLHNPP